MMTVAMHAKSTNNRYSMNTARAKLRLLRFRHPPSAITMQINQPMIGTRKNDIQPKKLFAGTSAYLLSLGARQNSITLADFRFEF
jgi:hypothetical protein